MYAPKWGYGRPRDNKELYNKKRVHEMIYVREKLSRVYGWDGHNTSMYFHEKNARGVDPIPLGRSGMGLPINERILLSWGLLKSMLKMVTYLVDSPFFSFASENSIYFNYLESPNK